MIFRGSSKKTDSSSDEVLEKNETPESQTGGGNSFAGMSLVSVKQNALKCAYGAVTYRAVLLVIYVALTILLCCMQRMTLFESPEVLVSKIMASNVVAMKVLISDNWYEVSNTIDGANVTMRATFGLWNAGVKLTVAMPYEFAAENISQEYGVHDIPCAEYRAVMKKCQTFSLLSIFSSVIMLVFLISNFFSRMFLPLFWFFLWLTIIFVSSTTAMMMKLLCNGTCYGTEQEIPPFVQLAYPLGGFALSMLSMQIYLFSSIMAVFL